MHLLGLMVQPNDHNLSEEESEIEREREEMHSMGLN